MQHYYGLTLKKMGFEWHFSFDFKELYQYSHFSHCFFDLHHER